MVTQVGRHLVGPAAHFFERQLDPRPVFIDDDKCGPGLALGYDIEPIVRPVEMAPQIGKREGLHGLVIVPAPRKQEVACRSIFVRR